MREIPAASVDLVLTDVPYAISREGADIVRSGGHVLKQDFFACDRDTFAVNAMVLEAVRESIRALKDDGAFYAYCGHSQFGFIEAELARQGFKTGFLVWTKTSPAPSVRKAGWVSAAELCVRGWRAGTAFHFSEHSEMLNVFRCASMRHGSPGKTEHPTQKPLDVIAPIIQAQSDVDDLVLDPFAGSGTTGAAAVRMGRRFIGWEQDPEFHAIATKRLREAAAQPPLIHRPARAKQQGLGFSTGEAPQAPSNSVGRRSDPEEVA